MTRIELTITWLLSLATLVQPHQISAEESHEQVEMYGEIIEVGRQKVNDDYAMLHMRFTTKEENRSSSETSVAVYQYEFWSVDDALYRVDSECLEASDESLMGQRYRFIVSDKGYVALYSPKADAKFSVTDVGEAELGRGLIRGKAFYMVQGKLFKNLHARTGFPRISERRENYSLVTDSLEDDSRTGHLSFSYTYSVPAQKFTQHVAAVFDTKNAHVILQATSQSESSGASTFSKMNCSYDFEQFGTVPRKVVTKTGDTVDLDKDATAVETIETQYVDHAPIAMEVFDVPAGINEAPTSVAYVWGRRLLLLFLAASCACGYVFLRRRSRAR